MQRLLQKFELILFWLLVILLAFIPLYPKFPLANVSGTFVAIRIEDLLIFLALFLWLIYILLSKQVKSYISDKLNQSILLFFFIGAVSLFSAAFVTNTATPSLGVLHYLRRIEYMMLLPLAFSVVKTKKQLIIILIVLSVVVFLVNIYALGQRYLEWPVISTGNSEFSKGQILRLTPDARVNSTFAGHYDLAVFLAMVLVTLSAIFFSFKSFILKTWSILLAALSFLVLVMTAARLSFVAAVLGVSLSFILVGKKSLLLVILAFTVLALVYPSQLQERLISTFTINIQGGGQRYISNSQKENETNNLNLSLPVATPAIDATKLDESLNASPSNKPYTNIVPGEPTDGTQLGVYRSFGIRFDQEWPRAVRAFMKNPLLGTGYSSVGLATDNDLLRSFAEVGLLGTLTFSLIFIEIAKRIWKIYRSSEKFYKYVAAGTISLIFGFLLNALFIDVFEASKVASLFWMFLGVTLAAEKFKPSS